MGLFEKRTSGSDHLGGAYLSEKVSGESSGFGWAKEGQPCVIRPIRDDSYAVGRMSCVQMNFGRDSFAFGVEVIPIFNGGWFLGIRLFPILVNLAEIFKTKAVLALRKLLSNVLAKGLQPTLPIAIIGQVWLLCDYRRFGAE